jgi:hypothetical protein
MIHATLVGLHGLSMCMHVHVYVSMCVCVCMHRHIHSIHTHIHTYSSVLVCFLVLMYVCMSKHTLPCVCRASLSVDVPILHGMRASMLDPGSQSLHVRVCMHTYIYIYIYTHVCVCVCVYVYIYIYMHTRFLTGAFMIRRGYVPSVHLVK